MITLDELKQKIRALADDYADSERRVREVTQRAEKAERAHDELRAEFEVVRAQLAASRSEVLRLLDERRMNLLP